MATALPRVEAHRSIPMDVDHARSARWAWAVITGVLLLHWMGFFPAVMTFDSLDQWHQVITGHIVDWHPAAHTLFIGIFQKLSNSPAAVSAVQAVLFSGLFGWSLFLSARMYPEHRLQRWLMAGFVILTPIVGLYSVTLWKDVIFSLAIAAVVLLAAGHLPEWPPGLPWKLVVTLAGLLATVGLSRRSGLVVLALIALVWVLAQPRARKIVVASTLVALAIVATTQYVVLPQFDVIPGDAAAAAVPYHFLARAVVEGEDLDSETLQLITRVQSLEQIRAKFDPYRVDYLLGEETNWAPLAEDSLRFATTAAKEGLESPLLMLRHLVDTGGLAWNPLPRQDRLYIGSTTVEYYGYPIDDGIRSFEVPGLTDFLTWRVRSTGSGFLLWLVWRPGLYLWLLVFAVWFWLRDLRKFLVVTAPPLASALAVALVNPAPDVRYSFPVYLSLVVLIPFLTFGRHRARAPRPAIVA